MSLKPPRAWWPQPNAHAFTQSVRRQMTSFITHKITETVTSAGVSHEMNSSRHNTVTGVQVAGRLNRPGQRRVVMSGGHFVFEIYHFHPCADQKTHTANHYILFYCSHSPFKTHFERRRKNSFTKKSKAWEIVGFFHQKSSYFIRLLVNLLKS